MPKFSPETYTQSTQAFLDRAFSERTEEGRYRSHEPVYGFGSRSSHASQAARTARTARILQVLSGESFADLLDVGSGEGYTADLVRELFDVRVVGCDLSREGCLRGVERFGLPSVACNASVLPFPDLSFDAVLCSEVIEHAQDPFRVLSELMRVARRFVLVTTAECLHSEWERRLVLKLRNLDIPHVEMNWWLPGDFRETMGEGVETQRQIREYGLPSDSEKDMAVVRAGLDWSVRLEGLEREGTGVFVLWRRPGASPASSSREPIACRDLWDRLLAPRPIGKPENPEHAASLLASLCCPLCHRPLERREDRFLCRNCAKEWNTYLGRVPDLTLAGGDVTALPLPGLDPFAVRRLRRLFDPTNTWSGRKRALAKVLLGLAEIPRDGHMGRPLRTTLRRVRGMFREAWQEIDPRAEGCLVSPHGSDRIYLIERRRKRHITSFEIFLDMGFTLHQVKKVDPAWLDRFPAGKPLDAASK